MDAFPLWVNLVLTLVSAVLLALAAKIVVDSAVAIAQRFGVSELVVGLTVVAFGTSAPEFGVTLVSALQGQNEISVGNIVGSNIFNIGFILGGAALIRAISASKELVWRDAGMLAGSSLLLVLLIGLDLRLSHLDGVILLLVLVGYLWVVFLQRKGVAPAPEDLEELAPATAHPLREGFRLMLGLASIGMASHLLILSASAVAGVLENLEIKPAAQGSLIALAAMTLVFLRSGWQLTRREGIMLILVGAFRWAQDFMPHFLG